MDELTLRDARPEDRDTVRSVTLAAYEEYAASMPDHWEAYRGNIVATLAAVGPAAQVVAERRGSIVGTVLLYPAGSQIETPRGPIALRWPEVRLLAVPPAGRGHGVGAALMRECIRRARESRAEQVTLHTTDLMKAAMRLYDRLGFQRAPELDVPVGPGVTIEGYRLPL